jgi:ribonuclease T1
MTKRGQIIEGRDPSWTWPGWVRLLAGAILVALVLYSMWRQQRPDLGSRRQTTADSEVASPLDPAPRERERQTTPGSASSPAPVPESHATRARRSITNQTIRSEDGKVVFRGEIDVGPTLDRIQRGERLNFPHDGSTFQNRERRLPRQAAGYYKEHVHPTPGLRGPGPQRIVTGERGEIYYTPDHYRTFEQLDRP